MPLVDLTKFNGVPMTNLQYVAVPWDEELYAAVDEYNALLAMWKKEYEAFKAEQRTDTPKDIYDYAFAKQLIPECQLDPPCNFDGPCNGCQPVTQYDIAPLKDAVMSLASLCEYLIVLTGKKANKMEREAMLTQIDNIRTSLGNL